MVHSKCLRVGRVTLYSRGKTWCLRYFENGRRRQVRVGPDKNAARQLAAQVNAQLEVGAPAATSFEPIGIPELRTRWLEHHEHVLRSSVSTIDRYRSASEHLLRFIRDVQPIKHVSQFRETHAEACVRYLRELKVAPNGHAHTAKRHLKDKGIKFVLEVCRTLFSFALKRRHLPPYSENPFTTIQIDRIPIEDAKPITLFTAEQECQFLEACDDWQLPIFATLMYTGMRPGELTHLLLSENVNLGEGWVHVRNKPELGWQVKTRNERQIPLIPELVEILRFRFRDRCTGPLFQRRRSDVGEGCAMAKLASAPLRAELERRNALQNVESKRVDRAQQRRLAKRLWVEMGFLREDRLRGEFMKLTAAIELPQVTAPKSLRHMFATRLQETNVDPLIRNQLMGHIPFGDAKGKGPLGMTGIYTHASPATIRRQLFDAMRTRPATEILQRWLKHHAQTGSTQSDG